MKNRQNQRDEGCLTFGLFLRDKLLLFLLHLSCMLVFGSFLLLTGYPGDYCILLLSCWLLILAAWVLYEYHDRKQYFARIGRILDQADQRFLLGELMPDSPHAEDRLYREMIRQSNKSVIERIRRAEDAQREYREYIESWVHEIKAPITSISLMCENRRSQLKPADAQGIRSRAAEFQDRDNLQIAMENQKVENYVDMALYYARSDEVYKDYVIQETDLQTTAEEAVMKNKFYLIQNKIRVDVQCEGQKVYTDRKWILFILNQLLLNCIKYKSEEDAYIRIYTQAYQNGIYLYVEDNGSGIKKEELSRIFEKGFTGTNGRKNDRATGMGLYLCRKLCKKLGIGIDARSAFGFGTALILEFPVSSYTARQISLPHHFSGG